MAGLLLQVLERTSSTRQSPRTGYQVQHGALITPGLKVGFSSSVQALILSSLIGRVMMELLSPSPSLRRRRTRRKVVGSTLWGDSSGAAHRLKSNKVWVFLTFFQLCAHAKDPILRPSGDLYFSSWTPVEQPRIISFPKTWEISRKQHISTSVYSLPQKCWVLSSCLNWCFAGRSTCWEGDKK